MIAETNCDTALARFYKPGPDLPKCHWPSVVLDEPCGILVTLGDAAPDEVGRNVTALKTSVSWIRRPHPGAAATCTSIRAFFYPFWSLKFSLGLILEPPQTRSEVMEKGHRGAQTSLPSDVEWRNNSSQRSENVQEEVVTAMPCEKS